VEAGSLFFATKYKIKRGLQKVSEDRDRDGTKTIQTDFIKTVSFHVTEGGYRVEKCGWSCYQCSK